MGFISIRVAFLRWFAKPNATLLLYPGLGPAMLRRLKKVFQSTQAEFSIHSNTEIKYPSFKKKRN
jgi:hypothetical protein